ncbi:MAG: hypothetical protein Q4F05_01795 [bacterium]|nr:hypothetical protein [bacterium]
MKNFRFVVGRNLTLYLENKIYLAFSCLAIITIMSMYFIFLRDFMFQMVEDKGISRTMRGLISDRLMVSGLLMVVSTVTCFGGIHLQIKEKEVSEASENLTLPISIETITLGNLFSVTAISASYTMLTFITYEFYFYYRYGSELTSETAVIVLLTILFASFINAVTLYVLTARIRTRAEFFSFASLYGIIFGFLTGAYLPYFFYAKWLKKLLFLLPSTQTTSIIRQLFLTDTLAGIRPKLSIRQLESFKTSFGIYLKDLTSKRMIMRQEQYALLLVEVLLVLGGILISLRRSQER